MIPLKLDIQRLPTPKPVLSSDAFAFLNHLRFVAMGCRAKPKTDLFQACALLHANRFASQEAHAEALMRCLSEALGKPARLHAPGSTDISFDESWLVQLGRACAQDDDANLRFLLHSRVAPEHRRLVGFLVTRISECFSLH